ncbi:fatty acid desaturase [uncultured Nevskia sp.]|uniref:acyl-CoA desaturase n=1 Tax=uncultured Nevskia sp. TaxID=228950 RepID=UPI0025CD4CA9|nr:fatty acid desaturase [uncultured Nevskia sp.]
MTAANPASSRPAINKPAYAMFTISTALLLTVFPWYLFNYDVSASAWVAGVALLYACGLSITGGYHRLWAHRAYQAHWSLKAFYLLFGAMAFQNSVLVWASTHRIHHANVDDVDHDPYSINRGLWYAHIGWMLRDYPSARTDYSNARDLLDDRLVMFQHNYYLPLALFMNIGFPLLLGWAMGDVMGYLMVAGLLRLVVNHHVTFLINSLAHYWGRRPYTIENTARDNDLLAFLTYGEGYHNYHHLFQWDYRNGVRWWQYDPTKWLIASLSWVGITRELRRVPEFRIQRAMLQRQFDQVRERLTGCNNEGRVAVLQQRFEHELETFKTTVNAWSHLQSQRIEAARDKLADQWQHSDMRQQLLVLEDRLREQRQRMQPLHWQTA